MAYIHGQTDLLPIVKDLLKNETFAENVFQDAYRQTIFSRYTSERNDGVIIQKRVKQSGGMKYIFSRLLTANFRSVPWNGPSVRTVFQSLHSSVSEVECETFRTGVESEETFLQAIESKVDPAKFSPLNQLKMYCKQHWDQILLTGMTSRLYPIGANNVAAHNGLVPRTARCFTCRTINADIAENNGYKISTEDTFTYAHDHPLSYQLGAAARINNNNDRLSKMSVDFIRRLVKKARVNPQGASPLMPYRMSYKDGLERDEYILVMGYDAANQLKNDPLYEKLHYSTFKDEPGIASGLNDSYDLGMVEDVHCFLVPLISKLLPSFDINSGNAQGKAAWSLLLGRGAAAIANSEMIFGKEWDDHDKVESISVGMIDGASALRFDPDPIITEVIDARSTNKKFEQGIMHVFTRGE